MISEARDGRPPGFQVLHLSGGLRLITGPETWFGPLRKLAACCGPAATPDAIKAFLRANGLRIIGVDYGEIDFRAFDPQAIPDFRSGAAKQQKDERPDQLWSEIANAAHEKSFVGFDAAHVIRHAFRNIEYRISCLSRSYNQVLQSRLADDDATPGHFGNLFSDRILNECSTLIVELLSLESFLCRFCGRVVHGISDADRFEDVKHLHGKSRFVAKLRALKQGHGILALLAQYRHLFIHSSPIQAAGHGFLEQAASGEIEGEPIQIVRFNLPPNPFRINNVRRSGSEFGSVDEWIKAQAKLLWDEKNRGEDAADFCLRAYRALIELSKDLAEESPFKRKPVHLRPEDMRDFRVTYR